MKHSLWRLFLHRLCGLLGHFPEPHRRVSGPDYVVGLVKCRLCHHQRFVDEHDRYVETDDGHEEPEQKRRAT